jgi:hypothetical protein
VAYYAKWGQSGAHTTYINAKQPISGKLVKEKSEVCAEICSKLFRNYLTSGIIPPALTFQTLCQYLKTPSSK